MMMTTGMLGPQWGGDLTPGTSLCQGGLFQGRDGITLVSRVFWGGENVTKNKASIVVKWRNLSGLKCSSVIYLLLIVF